MPDIWDKIQSIYNIRFVLQYQEQFLLGLYHTLIAAGLALILSLIIGFMLALMSISGNRLLTLAASSYIQIIRSTPLLLQIYIIYFGLPYLLPFFARLPEIVLGIMALTLHTCAYMSEIIRSGLLSVPQGQRLGAMAMGMTSWQQYAYVIIPQAVINIIPALMGQTAILIKDTSLLSLITVFDLVSAGMLLNSDLIRPTEGFMTIAAIFLSIYLMMVFLSNRVNHFLTGRGWRG